MIILLQAVTLHANYKLSEKTVTATTKTHTGECPSLAS